MPKKMDLSDVVPSLGGDFEQLPEGAYVVRVTDVVDYPEKDYMELVFDIAEGPHAGRYSDEWGLAHPYAHRVVVSYKSTAKGLLKGWLGLLSASNPGFDAEAAYDGACVNPAMLGLFVGKEFGLSMLHEHRDKDGKPLSSPRPDWMRAKPCTPAEVRAGTAKPPKRGERNTPAPQGAQPGAAADAYDVPFF